MFEYLTNRIMSSAFKGGIKIQRRDTAPSLNLQRIALFALIKAKLLKRVIFLAKAAALFSGSKGNSYYIGTSNEGVLIDAGKNCKQIELAMEAHGLSMSSIKAVFITHEHSDHCSALKVLSKKYRFDVYASAGTLCELEKANRLYPGTNTFEIKDSVALGNMLIERIDTPHDAAESCCYRVVAGDGKSALVATDMGIMTPSVRQAALKSDFAVLESNHDIQMLKTGIYPFYLKQRILSNKGHLSNAACANELAQLVQGGTFRLMLGHLSEQNNTPQIALATAVNTLENAGMKYKSDFTLDIAPSEITTQSVIF